MLDACVAFESADMRAQQDDLARMIRILLGRFKICHLKSVSQLATHCTIAGFKDNGVPMSELVVLLCLLTGNIGAIGYDKSLLWSTPDVCNLTVIDDELLHC